jgi:adenylate cyclase
MNKSIVKLNLIGNAIIWLMVLIFMLYTVFQPISNNIYDFDMRQSMSHEPHEDIIVVGIDEASLKEYGKFPWDRDVYIPFLQQVSLAKAITFDIMFNTDSQNKENDTMIIEELKKHDNVIMAASLVTETTLSQTFVGKAGSYFSAYDVNKPIPAIAEVVDLAHIYRQKDEDGSTRRTHVAVNTPEGMMYSLAYLTVQKYGADVESYQSSNPKTVQMSSNAKGEQLIKFNATSDDFNFISFKDIKNVPPENFEDRIVFVGITAAGEDVGTTPVDKAMYLVYAHANITDMMLNGQELTIAQDWVIFIVTLILLAATAFITWRLKAITSIVYLFSTTIVLLVAQYYIFKFNEIFIDPVYPLVALYFSFLINIAIKTFFETKQKNYITKQFGRYISPDLVKEIASSGQEIQLGGMNKELSLLFLDVRGFTTLSEKLKAEEVVGFLNMMFNLITEKALENHGTIDKFIGDAAMILFNAPLDVNHHEYYAVKTAYDIQKGMEAVRKDIQEKFGVVISVGIGIHTGEVVVGNIGSYLRVDYTAIGDNVNTAARIESQTTANQILVSEVTYERTKDNFEFNFAGERMMKGKTVGVKLYEVLEHTKPVE